VSQAGANTPANHFGGSFGPNEWLVQEMYERYQSDPSSVDKAWWDFFSDFKGTQSSNGATTTNSPKPGTPPIPKSQQTQVVPVAATAPAIVETSVKANQPEIKKIDLPEKTSKTSFKQADQVVKQIPTPKPPGA